MTILYDLANRCPWTMNTNYSYFWYNLCLLTCSSSLLVLNGFEWLQSLSTVHHLRRAAVNKSQQIFTLIIILGSLGIEPRPAGRGVWYANPLTFTSFQWRDIFRLASQDRIRSKVQLGMKRFEQDVISKLPKRASSILIRSFYQGFARPLKNNEIFILSFSVGKITSKSP